MSHDDQTSPLVYVLILIAQSLLVLSQLDAAAQGSTGAQILIGCASGLILACVIMIIKMRGAGR